MAIDWSLNRQPDIIGNAYASMRQGQEAGLEQGKRNAYAAYAANPETGAAGLAKYDPVAYMQIQSSQRQEKRQTAQDERQTAADQQKVFTDTISMLGGYGRRVRSDADLAALKSNPVFQQVYAKATANLRLKTPIEALTLEQVRQFNNEASKIQGVNLGGGGYGTFDPDTGEFKTLREPTDKPIIIGNGATALDPDTGKPIYSNPKTFAPPRAASGGASSVPSGFVLD